MMYLYRINSDLFTKVYNCLYVFVVSRCEIDVVVLKLRWPFEYY